MYRVFVQLCFYRASICCRANIHDTLIHASVFEVEDNSEMCIIIIHLHVRSEIQ